jgi:hypothetical protein
VEYEGGDKSMSGGQRYRLLFSIIFQSDGRRTREPNDNSPSM